MIHKRTFWKGGEIMNKVCRAITFEEFESIISMLREGFEFRGTKVKSKERIADALVLEANLGLRIDDILHLTFSSFVKVGSEYYLDVIEQKTGKKADIKVPAEVMNYIQDYVIKWGLGKEQHLFPFRVRNVQKYLDMVCKSLKLKNVGTHSFRKFSAKNVYEESGYDPRVVQEFLRHSSLTTTQRYLGVSKQKVNAIVEKCVCIA